MTPLDPLGISLSDPKMLLGFNHLDYVKTEVADEQNSSQKETCMNEKALSEILISISQSVDTSSLNDFLLSMANFYELIKNRNSFPEVIVNIINESQFYSNIYTSLNHSLYRSPQFKEDKVVIELTLNILFALSFISDDIIKGFFETGIIDYLFKFFLDLNFPFLPKLFSYFFGNVFTIEEIAIEYISPLLFEKIIHDFENTDISVLAAQLYFVFILNKYEIPTEFHSNFLFKLRSILFLLSNYFDMIKTKEFETMEDKESFRKNCLKSISYILEVIMTNLSSDSYRNEILNSMIPSLLMDIFDHFPILVQIRILEIFHQSLIAAHQLEDSNLFELMINKLDVDHLYLQFSSDNDRIIQHILDIFRSIQEIDNSFILQLIPKAFVPRSIYIIEHMNFNTKVKLLNFISLSILNDDEDTYSFHFLTEEIVESFLDFEDNPKVDNVIGVLTKLFQFSYDIPQLYDLLKPYVIDECVEE